MENGFTADFSPQHDLSPQQRHDTTRSALVLRTRQAPRPTLKHFTTPPAAALSMLLLFMIVTLIYALL